MELTEKTLDQEIIYEGPIFRVVQYRMRMPDGRVSLRDVVVNPNAAAVVAVDDDGCVLMVRQYRRTADSLLLEIPAGR
jgi:ADP-ribose pyrophosphatase